MPPKRPVATSQDKKTSHQLNRATSDVRAFTGGNVIKNFYVWTTKCPAVVENPDIVFGRCLVLPGSTETKFRLRQTDPVGDGAEFEVDRQEACNTNLNTIDEMLDMHDIGSLAHQNVAAVLDLLKHRWYKKSIYTSTDPLLIVVNPFRDVGLTTNQMVSNYHSAKNFESLSPHTFRLARECQENYHSFEKSQTLIVTGESGAGKTECTKHVLQYFASAKEGDLDTRVQTAVMSANPILEAFGNAKTIRNNNSSRFGKFMKLKVGKKEGIVNGSVNAFLLEKVRVVSQEKNERSYHVFYQFLKSSDAKTQEKYDLLPLKEYASLNDVSGGCYDVHGVDDVKEWGLVVASFSCLGLSSQQIDSICRIISGVLMLNNTKPSGTTIGGQDGVAKVDGASKDYLKRACKLLCLPTEDIENEVCTTVQKIGTEFVKRQLQVKDAVVMLQSLSKALYEKLFLWIITQLNETIEPEGSITPFVGMLDIFGFEIFEHNSMEQLLINITNEYLQDNFVDIVFKKEQKLYMDEGVPTGELKFTSNKDVIDILIGKNSVFTTLEDCCLAPGGNDEAMVSMMNRKFEKNPAYMSYIRGKQPMFIICHSVADVLYSSTGFIQKNIDVLKPGMMEIVQKSEDSIVKSLFEGIVFEKGKLAKGQLLASQFIRSLQTLMNVILSTETHFIRCIKPNENKSSTEWNAVKVLNQLFSLSILEALQLKQIGYAYKRPYDEFCKQFRYLDLAGVDSGMERREVALRILKKASMDEPSFMLGKTMVFMKPDATRFLSHVQRVKLEQWKKEVCIIEALMMHHMRAVDMQALQQCAIRIQANHRCAIMGPPNCNRAEFVCKMDATSKNMKQAALLGRTLKVDPWFDRFMTT